MQKWIDVHTHLNILEEGAEAAVQAAAAVGVERLITIGTEPGDLQTVLDLAEKFHPVVACTLGVHPHDAKAYTSEVEEFIRQHVQDKTVVAIGEIGLDYYYDQSPRDVQKSVFRQQLQLAKECNLPVQIHTRDAEEDTVAILSEFKGKVTGIIHCFTSSEWLARQCLDLGFNISISGVATFKNADSLREIVKMVPLERLHVETDAPFLAPVPMRGKKNTSAYVVHTAQFVAQLKGVSESVLATQTRENALKIFPKLVW